MLWMGLIMSLSVLFFVTLAYRNLKAKYKDYTLNCAVTTIADHHAELRYGMYMTGSNELYTGLDTAVETIGILYKVPEDKIEEVSTMAANRMMNTFKILQAKGK